MHIELKEGKRYYSIGEVAKAFNVNASLIRFWDKEFDILKPKKNAKGNRMFTPEDVKKERLAKVQQNLDRLGLLAKLQTGDAAEPASWWDGQLFDRILADVPCSASGVVRRHPDIKWLRRHSDVAKFATTQAKIIDSLWQLLAPGGKLLYATCSIFPLENRQQAEAFAARHADAERLPLPDGVTEQLLPNAEHDGFYYALFRKQCG